MPKTKSFQKYIETRFSKEELVEIEAEAAAGVRKLKNLSRCVIALHPQKKEKLTSLEVDTRELFDRDEANER